GPASGSGRRAGVVAEPPVGGPPGAQGAARGGARPRANGARSGDRVRAPRASCAALGHDEIAPLPRITSAPARSFRSAQYSLRPTTLLPLDDLPEGCRCVGARQGVASPKRVKPLLPSAKGTSMARKPVLLLALMGLLLGSGVVRGAENKMPDDVKAVLEKA